MVPFLLTIAFLGLLVNMLGESLYVLNWLYDVVIKKKKVKWECENLDLFIGFSNAWWTWPCLASSTLMAFDEGVHSIIN